MTATRHVVYVKPGCPYCAEAGEDLTADGVDFEERDATERPEWREELMRFSKNTGRVPTVVLGDRVVSVGWKGRG